MTANIPTNEPSYIRAGDTITWLKCINDYPASDGWVLNYRLINTAGNFDIVSTASGGDHLVAVDAATSATYTAGDYKLLSWVEKALERFSIASMPLKVLPDLAAEAAGYDTRSNAKKTLDLIDAAILSHGTNAWVQSYTIDGRSMTFRSVSEFISFRSKIKQEVIREENAERMRNGLALKNKINIRM